MKVKIAALIFAIIFFGAMIFLTISARDIRNKVLPNVKVSRLTKEVFEYEYISNLGIKELETELCLGIPKELYDNNEIYVIDNVEINGENRTIAKSMILEIGRENDKYYEVINDYIDSRLRFIIYSDKKIQEGDEVYVNNP